MKICISSEHSFLTDFVNRLPVGFENQGIELYKVRNEVRLIEVNGIRLVVKKFKVPHLINRIAYSIFRKSKAKRSYEYSKMLIDSGFGAATPIAYREDKKFGLLNTSYYISLFCDYGRDFNEFRWAEMEGKAEILRDFARFTAKLHEAGIQHLDYGGGNILFRETEKGAEFCLIDINRMSIGKVTMKAGIENLKLLYLREELFICLIEEYAKCRGFDFDRSFDYIRPFIVK